MNLKNKSLKSKIEGFYYSIAAKSAYFSKIILGVAVLMLVGLTATTATYAQRNRNQSVCESYGYSDTDVDLNGIWKLSFMVGGTDYVTTLGIRNQQGTSITRYYDSSEQRTRRVSQTHRVCESEEGIVVLGFSPVDMETKESGSNFGYSADNYYIFLQGGRVTAYNVDDAGTRARINIEFVRELR